ncbi:hypothetical protein J4419_00350 [Candidatus Woesearchaeota archaeon]|nr:hypothetical protein [Candidatus Woesearchaeota archaeon]
MREIENCIVAEIYYVANPSRRLRKNLPIAALMGNGNDRPATCNDVVEYLLDAPPDPANPTPYSPEEEMTAFGIQSIMNRMQSDPNFPGRLLAKTMGGKYVQLDPTAYLCHYLATIPILEEKQLNGKVHPSLVLEMKVEALSIGA